MQSALDSSLLGLTLDRGSLQGRCTLVALGTMSLGLSADTWIWRMKLDPDARQLLLYCRKELCIVDYTVGDLRKLHSVFAGLFVLFCFFLN